MAVNINKPHLISAFQTSDIRTLRFYARYLNNASCLPNAPKPLPLQPRSPLPEVGTVKELKEAFNVYLGDYSLNFTDGSSPQTLNTQLINLAQEHILEIEKFKWLEKNEGACIFFYVSTSPSVDLNDLSQGLEQARSSSKHTLAKSHEARYKSITEKFDSLEFNPTFGKREYFKSLENQYTYSQHRFKPFPWLTPDNREACRWAWHYLINYHDREIASAKESGRLGFTLSGTVGIPQLFWLTPSDPNEQYLSFNACLQAWKGHPAELKQLRINIAKAWRQQQIRKSTTTKPINTHIKAEAKAQLDDLSRYYKWSLPKTLEVLISDAHREIKNDT